jgi:putative Mg2+ transporter-C (MgtC) family protein
MSSVLATQPGPDVATWEELVRLLLVGVLAGAIGIERELRDHDAGLRTHVLVGVGAALFVLAGTFSWSSLELGNTAGVMLDPSRVTAYVVTGVGFLGAGAIIKYGGGVRGLTTAASLWVVAAIGVTVASGQYVLGVFATAIVLLSLWPLKLVAHELGIRQRRAKRIVVSLGPDSSLGDVVAAVERPGVDLQSTTILGTNGTREVQVAVSGSENELALVLEQIARARGVTGASLEP